MLSSSFKITSTSSSVRLERAMQRYQDIVSQASLGLADASASKSGSSLQVLDLKVLTDDEVLSSETDYSYTLDINDTVAVASARTIYGAMYACETFSQLVGAGGVLSASGVHVDDHPDYVHRSVMIDAGRRFFPVSTVESIIDGMAYNKMNVLHMHLSDNCRFAVESKLYPALTEGLTGIVAGHYTQEDIRSLVAYAGDRGVRVVPEIDIPGHAQGFQNMSGLGITFCATSGDKAYNEMFNDTTTITTLKALFSEMAELFPDKEFHIGADETGSVGECSQATCADIETKLAEHVISLGKRVIGWEEYAFRTGVAQATGDYIVNTWHYFNALQSVEKGFRTIASDDSHFYLLYGMSWRALWTDIATGMSSAQRTLLLGGSVSAWMDNYCYINYCTHPDKAVPKCSRLFGPGSDERFHRSVSGVIFPRAAVGGGSFWNFRSDVMPTSNLLTQLFTGANERLIKRAVATCACPGQCDCDAACGVKY